MIDHFWLKSRSGRGKGMARKAKRLGSASETHVARASILRRVLTNDIKDVAHFARNNQCHIALDRLVDAASRYGEMKAHRQSQTAAAGRGGFRALQIIRRRVLACFAKRSYHQAGRKK